ncbi:MAG: site-specific tyrosine recombinase XerD [Bacteroidales bacterium]|nr:site-specific tyrosine recombinase XerD [Bacteroidales bacterium]
MSRKTTTTLEQAAKDFRSYLRFERSLSQNTVEGYSRDISKLVEFLLGKGIDNPSDIDSELLNDFISEVASTGIKKRSQARIISSVRAFFKFLENEGDSKENPSDRLDSPKMQQYLPTVLSVEEVISIIESVDLSKPEGHRNRAILEMLYSCGLRVSELINLRISDLFFDEGFIRVMGKGSKQRLIPVGEPAVKAVQYYMQQRNARPVKHGSEDILFLNRRGGKLTRVMIFTIVKNQTEIAGVRKDVSPHTFRHSFASHLVENGADLRVVQQMLGHESILTTEIYTHIDTKKWQENILKYHHTRNK